MTRKLGWHQLVVVISLPVSSLAQQYDFGGKTVTFGWVDNLDGLEVADGLQKQKHCSMSRLNVLVLKTTISSVDSRLPVATLSMTSENDPKPIVVPVNG